MLKQYGIMFCALFAATASLALAADQQGTEQWQTQDAPPWAPVGALPPGTNGAQFRAVLDGNSEVPLVVTTGSGQVTASVSSDQKAISVTLNFAKLAGVAKSASIYLGLPGTIGGAVAPICGGTMPACPSTADGSVTATVQASDVTAINTQGLAAGDLASVITALNAGHLYVNVVTDKFSNGEIRGQLAHGFDVGRGHN